MEIITTAALTVALQSGVYLGVTVRIPDHKQVASIHFAVNQNGEQLATKTLVGTLRKKEKFDLYLTEAAAGSTILIEVNTCDNANECSEPARKYYTLPNSDGVQPRTPRLR